MTWGLAEFIAAEEFHRFRGYWWAPDGRTVLAARVDESRVQRWHLHDPAQPEPAPTAVAYPPAGSPERRGHPAPARPRRRLGRRALGPGDLPVPGRRVVGRRRRPADHRAAPARSSTAWCWRSTRAPARPRCTPSWPTRAGWSRSPGTPAHLPDGRVLVGGELAHDGYDARCLFADGSLLTPPDLYVRRVVRPASAADLIVEAQRRRAERAAPLPGPRRGRRDRCRGAPAHHRARLAHRPRSAATTLVDRRAVAGPRRGTQWTVRRGEQRSASCASHRRHPAVRARGRSWNGSPTGGCRPACSTRATTSPAAGCRCWSTSTAARATRRSWRRAPAWLERQWWADAGFAVVVIDNRGTPGVAPELREGDPPAVRRRDPDRPGRRAGRAGRASTPTWTWAGSRSAAGRSAAGWRRWRCCAARTCTAARSPAPR